MSSSSLIRERQQEDLLNVLRQARGAELTYDELRQAGIDFPAVIVSELQARGVPVERRYSGGRPQPSFRLVVEDEVVRADEDAQVAAAAQTEVDDSPTQAFDPVAAEAVAAQTEVDDSPAQAFDPVPKVKRIHLDGRQVPLTPSRLLGGGALLAAVVTVTVLVLNSVGGGGQAPHRRTAAAAVHRAASRYDQRLQAFGRLSHPPRRSSASQSSRKPAPAAPQSALQLETQGHQLLEQNQYASAIPVLQQAIRATGETPSACAQPTSQNCLTLAFALYDLGVAFRLSGDPSAAVPILERRLQINNQQGAVAYELKLAQDTTPSTATATQLEARGHSLLQSGQYTSAIPILQRAVKTTAESAGACAQPTTQSCLTYAFALYDLGVALRLSGNPSAAVPILQQRLRIGVARDVVAQELELAQSASG